MSNEATVGDISIRTFEPTDQAEVAALYLSGQDSHVGIPVAGECYHWFVNEKLKPDGDMSNIEKVYMSDPSKGCFWVAVLDNKIVGCVGALPYTGTRFGADHAELIRMFVSPDIRKRSLGARLISVYEDWAKANGYKHVYLTTLAAFAGANILYPKCGFALLETEDLEVTNILNRTEPTIVQVNHYLKSF